MKKILLTALVAVSALAANAQVWVGGSLGYENEKDTYTAFEIAPEVGYTLSDKVDLAIKLGFENNKPEGVDAQNYFTVNPYVRYTFYQTGAVGFFLDGGFSVKVGNNDVEAAWGVGIAPGVKFAASDKVTFVAKLGGLGYQKQKDAYETFGLKCNGGDLQFGVYYTF